MAMPKPSASEQAPAPIDLGLEPPTAGSARLDRPPILLSPGVPPPPRRRRRRRPVTDDTPITNADGLFGPGFPILPTKVQRPPLRAETLSRQRLTDWLSAHVHHRLVFITAEAGYGKTTLLADFARRTRLRVLWYRIDEQDRDWIAVLNYLVAAGREVDPDFATATAALLSQIGTGTASRERVVETFLRELHQLGSTRTVLIFDDWHLIDGAADVRDLMRQVVLHAPEKMSFVFASRWRPSLSVARFRARGDLAELTTADLRFSESEVERLFRETYGRPLEPDVLSDLSSRTEGWAACLQLVQTALVGRQVLAVRTFVRGLSAVDANLYEYLAEEVIGELDDPFRHFLMTTAILQTIEPSLAAVVTGHGPDLVKAHIEAAEKLGLLIRRGEATSNYFRYHILVRSFLLERLRREIGSHGILSLHKTVAKWAEGRSWQLAVHHFEAAREPNEAHRVIGASSLEIMSSGEYGTVAEFLERYPAEVDKSIHHIVNSRRYVLEERRDEALREAEIASTLAEAEGGSALELAQVNTIAHRYNMGEPESAMLLARQLADAASIPAVRDIATAYVLMAEARQGRSTLRLIQHLKAMANRQLAAGQRYFAGVSLLNLAVEYQVAGVAKTADEYARQALELLHPSDGPDDRSIGPEAAAAEAVVGWALAHTGRLGDGLAHFAAAEAVEQHMTLKEVIAEHADVLLWYGDLEDARHVLARLDSLPPIQQGIQDGLILTRAEHHLQLHDPRLALTELARSPAGPSFGSAGKPIRSRLLQATAEWMLGPVDSAWVSRLRATTEEVRRSGLRLWWYRHRILLARATRVEKADWDSLIATIATDDPAVLSMDAESVADVLGQLNRETLNSVTLEICARPQRWRRALRWAIDHSDSETRPIAAILLDQVGDPDDVPRLRHLAKQLRLERTPELGRGLAHRLAEPVFVEDQGRVILHVGQRAVAGSSLRRKVLALLCYLLSRPGFSATRDQVLDALWPDLEPSVASNSVHQTIYFLRRVFERPYKDDLSAGYVHHDSDVIWLDPTLIDSRSARCVRLMDRMRQHSTSDDFLELLDLYRGQFALDFAYEDWAASFRSSLHAEYLGIVEDSATRDAEAGHTDRAIAALRRALEIDPEADQLELLLLKLYRRVGALAAAAERYEHYSSVMRDQLGVAVPSLEELANDPIR